MSQLSQPSDSFVSVHLIDENKQFATDLDTYVDKSYAVKDADGDGLNYHIVSVFGSQSTGKSTLLNKLFGTKFDIMDETKRQQTTKGIWFSHANYIASTDETTSFKKNNDRNIYVLDVEGVDGRERADDKDFERKSALFALATSEILIVNIFEHQVGLYQGANMELLKTVMEVNLSLFHKQHEKCLLLFVVRDFTGLTPLSNLGQSLESDMQRIWSDLNKPDECKDSKLDDFFDLEFASISHKVFKPEEFEYDIKLLGDNFSNEKLFNANKYHKKIPVDAWALYSQQLWEQIDNNQDLDLPTQQILVSKFKCNEIMNGIYTDVFLPEFAAEEGKGKEAITRLKELRAKCINDYDLHASRYKKPVFLEIKQDLVNKIDAKLEVFQTSILKELVDEIVSEIEPKFLKSKKDSKLSVKEIIEELKKDVIDNFETLSKNLLLVDSLDENPRYASILQKQREYLTETVEGVANKLRQKESRKLINRITKSFQIEFKDDLIEEFTQPNDNSWDVVTVKFDKLREKLLDKYKTGTFFDFKFGLTAEQNDILYSKIQQRLWNQFDSIVHDYFNNDNVSRILRNVFEDSFKYDNRGMPFVPETISQLDSRFNLAKNKTLQLLPILSKITLTDGKSLIKPQFKLDNDDDQDNDDENYNSGESDVDDSESRNRFTILLSPKEQAKVMQRFKKESDALYLDAKRAMIASKTSIPFYIWIIILVLGWNEFMAVLGNPILCVIILVGIGGFIVTYKMPMLSAALSMTGSSFKQHIPTSNQSHIKQS
ncbi:hypothetical protein CANINC_000044 [Pichia inconspicua]|uniref:GB1/RHD3-type G domain-containing protein n=1 Tax=Pichia inconspicua TaxID=52247 RepID=A0A4T0X7H5_9ASCO|nr:hypothetical protein CANINC_000044 [[Candida] inconspicua]